MSIEAMKQALEALHGVEKFFDGIDLEESFNPATAKYAHNTRADALWAITSLRQAIAEAEKQEPVALETIYETIIHWDEGGGKRSRRELARRIVALYTHPQPKAEQEPVAYTNDVDVILAKHWTSDYPPEGWKPLSYSHPQPKREPLTDEQIAEIVIGFYGTAIHHDDYDFARAIEAAHGIKGEA